jgi:hypothetical protein
MRMEENRENEKTKDRQTSFILDNVEKFNPG